MCTNDELSCNSDSGLWITPAAESYVEADSEGSCRWICFWISYDIAFFTDSMYCTCYTNAQFDFRQCEGNRESSGTSGYLYGEWHDNFKLSLIITSSKIRQTSGSHRKNVKDKYLYLK